MYCPLGCRAKKEQNISSSFKKTLGKLSWLCVTWFSETAVELVTHQSERGPAPSSQHPQGTTRVSCWNLHTVPQGHRSSLLSPSGGRPNIKGGGGGAVGLQVKGTVVECPLGSLLGPPPWPL